MRDAVGRVMQTLQELGLDDDTIVMFTVDHGICMGCNRVWGVSPYTFPAVGYRQCFNIPIILRQTNHIAPPQESNLMVMQSDWFRTLLDYISLNDIEIDDSPGKSLAPLLVAPPCPTALIPHFMDRKRYGPSVRSDGHTVSISLGATSTNLKMNCTTLHTTRAKTTTLLPTRPMQMFSLK
jgi:hypothetical protein